MSGTELALFAVAKEALASAVMVDEVKDVRDHAERIRLYGQQANDRTIIADATEIIMRAERRLGELLRNAHETGQLGIGRPSRSNVDEGSDEPQDEPQVEADELARSPVPMRVTLKEAGISKKLSTRSQKFAAVPETAFEAALKTAREKIIAGGAVVVNPLKDLSTAEKRSRRAAREIELGAKQMALPDAKFGVILTDDEWAYETWSEAGMDRSAENHYPTSHIDDLKKRDVASLAAPDAVYFMWTTAPFLAIAVDLMAHRGFTYKSCIIWHKIYPGERTGMGRWFWINHEILLVGTRGNVPAPAPGTQWPSVIEAEVDPVHSRKPEIFHQLIEDYFPTLPKIELNARVARPGWVRWGYEAPDQDPETKPANVAASEPRPDYAAIPTRVHLANCIMNCGARIYEGDAFHVTPDDEFFCSACAGAGAHLTLDQSTLTAGETEPLTPDQIDAILRLGDEEKTSLADLVISTGLTLDQVKKRRGKLGIASRDRQREAVAEANRRRAVQ